MIAVFYTSDLEWPWLIGALGAVAAVVLCRQMRVRYHAVYIALGLTMWFFILESGVHATIAGVIMGLLTPAVASLTPEGAEAIVDELEGRHDLSAADVHRVSILISEASPLTERLEYLLHPWTSYLIVPVFALVNAGIPLTRDLFGNQTPVTARGDPRAGRGQDRGHQPVLLGDRAARASARLPDGVRFSQLTGVAVLAGIGFTVSLFVSSLAFPIGPLLRDAKVGILVASVVAAAIGSVVLVITARRPSDP